MKKALTLIELLIAIILMGLIIVGVFAFDSASRTLLRSSEIKVDVLNDLTFVMEHMHKNVLLGFGDVNNPALTLTVAPQSGDPNAVYTLVVYQDTYQTPTDRTDDTVVTYEFDLDKQEVRVTVNDRRNDTTIQDILADNLTGADITLGTGTDPRPATPSAAGVWVNQMSMKYDPTDATVDQTNNPELEIKNQYFFPLSQSLS